MIEQKINTAKIGIAVILYKLQPSMPGFKLKAIIGIKTKEAE